MPRLLFYVPFTRGGHGDLRDNAVELESDATVPCVINGIQITAIIAVFLGEEANNPVQPGDILVFHAHGGPNGTGMADNLGEVITMAQALVRLGAMNADQARQVFFLACYSSATGHIAEVWRGQNPNVDVFGAPAIVAGGIALITRHGGVIRNAMFFVGDPRIVQLP